jgi:hypothetical protein
MKNFKLLETIADISYIAGYNQHYSGNSRFDISEYIFWAKEFEEIYKYTDWDNKNYINLIEEFVGLKLNESISLFK